jgi:hypothetical protein
LEDAKESEAPMSLDWTTEQCAVPLPATEHEAEERDQVIFACGTIGLSTVTDENQREWLVRLHVWHELGRGQLLGKNPLGVLERWKGLETNVSDRSRERWRRDIVTAAFGRGEYHADRALGVTV